MIESIRGVRAIAPLRVCLFAVLLTAVSGVRRAAADPPPQCPPPDARVDPRAASGLAAAQTLLTQAAQLYNQGHLQQSVPIAARALGIAERALGREHPLVAGFHHAVATGYLGLRRPQLARPHIERALQIGEHATGACLASLPTTHQDFSLMFEQLDQLPQAISSEERATRAGETMLGSNHPAVVLSLIRTASLHDRLRQHERAIPLCERVLAAREATLPRNHVLVIEALVLLANEFMWAGHFRQMLPHRIRVVEIARRALGSRAFMLAWYLDDLGEAYEALGQDEPALDAFLEAQRIQRAALGPGHPQVARTLNDLASVYEHIGAPERAIPYAEQALQIVESTLGAGCLEAAQARRFLAVAYVQAHQHERARQVCVQAIQTIENALAPDDPNLGSALIQLASILYATGDYDRSVALSERGENILRARLGPNAPEIANAQGTLGNVHFSRGEFERALQDHEQALRQREALLGESAPDLAVNVFNVAETLLALHRVEEGLSTLERGLALEVAGLHAVSRHQSERGVTDFLTRFPFVDILMHFVAEHADDARYRRLGLLATLLFKARGEEEEEAMLAALEGATVGGARGLLTQWRSLRERRSVLGAEQTDERQQMDLEIRAIEDRLAIHTQVLRERRNLEDVGTVIPRVASRLDADAALVEFTTFAEYHDVAPTSDAHQGPPRYGAFILYPDGVHAFIDLGAKSTIDALAAALTAAATRERGAAGAIESAGRALFACLFAPVAAALRPSVRRLYLAPDGPLHLAPLHLMHDDHQWLADRYTVSYLTSGRDLLRERVTSAPIGPPTAIAVTRYAVPDWNLPGVQFQADVLPRLVPGIVVLRDDAATESALRELSAPRLLHVAAHGRFVEATHGEPDDPMERARLVMADAPPTLTTLTGNQPGVATAAEILTMNLYGTRLVVLSACETAQGSAATGQGVFGLRRAFLLAGAEALVTTQWDVDERAGAVFTVALYEGLRAGMRSADAVARAARVVRERDPDPFAWAPFILVGRDDSIDWTAPSVRPATATTAPQTSSR